MCPISIGHKTWYWGATLKHGVRIVTRALGHIRSPISDLGAAGEICHFAFPPPAEGPWPAHHRDFLWADLPEAIVLAIKSSWSALMPAKDGQTETMDARIAVETTRLAPLSFGHQQKQGPEEERTMPALRPSVRV